MLCKLVPGGWSSRSAEAQLLVPDAQVCGRAGMTDGGRRAPFDLVKHVDSMAGRSVVKDLAVASACALTRGSLSADRLPPPPSSARTARTCRPRTAWSTVRRKRRARRDRRTRGHGGRRAARPHPRRDLPASTGCEGANGPRPHGSYGRHRGRHRRVVYEAGGPKRSIFAPRGAFGRGDAMITGGQNRDPMPSGTPAPFPHTMRGRPDHRSASAVPVLTVGAGESKRVECIVKLLLQDTQNQ